MDRLTLILGGARSGKSRYAERLIEADGRPCTYIATSQIYDTEMADRVRLHQEQRPNEWTTVEEPLDLTGALKANSDGSCIVIVDCLTLWLTNIILAEKDVEVEIDHLISCLKDIPGPTLLVANEVGLGIVPENKLARLFRDHAGRLNQRIAEAADRVEFIAAGLPLTLKGTSS